MYERDHLRREIAKMKAYEYAFQDIPLLPVAAFHSAIQENVHSDLANFSNDHELMLSRLQLELRERKRLKSEEETLVATKDRIQKECDDSLAQLESLDKDLDRFLNASLPLQQLLGVNVSKMRQLATDAREILPAPLFHLFQEVSCWNEFEEDDQIEMEIVTSAEMNSDGENDSVVQDDAMQIDVPTDGRSLPAEEDSNSVFNKKHGVSLKLTFSSTLDSTNSDKRTVLIFSFLPKLNICVVSGQSTVISSSRHENIPLANLFTAADTAVATGISDMGQDSPNPANNKRALFDFRLAGGFAYGWVQRLCGLPFGHIGEADQVAVFESSQASSENLNGEINGLDDHANSRDTGTARAVLLLGRIIAAVRRRTTEFETFRRVLQALVDGAGTGGRYSLVHGTDDDGAFCFSGSLSIETLKSKFAFSLRVPFAATLKTVHASFSLIENQQLAVVGQNSSILLVEDAAATDSELDFLNLTQSNISETLYMNQIQFLDYLNGENGTNSSAVFGGSLNSAFDPVTSWRFLRAYNPILINDTLNSTNFYDLGIWARQHYILYRVLYEMPAPLFKQLARASPGRSVQKLSREINSTILVLEKFLYPWISPTHSSIREMQLSVKKGSVGIVIACGNDYFYVAQHLIISLQRAFNISLPFEVYYAGPSDLTSNRRAALARIPNVTVIDLHQHFPLETRRGTGFAYKPYAMLATSFETVLFLDADVTFLMSPLAALNSTLFRAHGAVFFHDRKLWHWGSFPGIRLFKDMNPHATNTGRRTLFARSEEIAGTTNEMESGFIPAHKGNTRVLFALLLAAKMNGKTERENVLYRAVHGDKESFWFACEALRVPYAFVPDYAGSIGILHERSTDDVAVICDGKPLHLDELRRPFWFHAGSILEWGYRDAEPPEYSGFSDLEDMIFHYEYEDEDELWDDEILCMEQSVDQSASISAEHAMLIELYRNIYRNDIIKVD
ncbi:hypothetical protein HDU84_003243 [Entophlyctis sp. JEL0112]|nr:hypothetical protein HDU84_003243 [Entophlyctis sp. JEL0112]